MAKKASKKELTKGVIKSLRTLDFGELYNNFRAKPTRTVVKTFLAGTGAEGAINSIMKQLNAGKKISTVGDVISAGSDLIGDTAANVIKRGAQTYSGAKKFAKNIYEKATQDFNEGGMAYARKKNMGLKYKKGGGHMKKKSPMATYKKGGSVKSSSKKSRGTGAAIKGTKFKGTF
jgi:hypothetical protein